MTGTIADELYGETLKLVDVKLETTSSVTVDRRDPQDGYTHQDGLWDDSGDGLDESSALDREWLNRREEFHTIGYRDGIIAGKEASAQEGFNIGFKESVGPGYRWGLVRGVTSALALLPNRYPGLQEKLVETDIQRTKLQRLYESTSSVSTLDALKSFHDDVIAKKKMEQDSNTIPSLPPAGVLDNYLNELNSFLKDSPSVDVRLTID